MSRPLLIIVNGPPGTGKTTLARRLASDLQLAVIHRDTIAETLFDGLDCSTYGRPPMIGPASFAMLHYCAGLLLSAGQSLIIEGCFSSTALATSEFRQLQQRYDFEPFQVQCRAIGDISLARFLARAGTARRHIYHRDREFAERNREIFFRERFADLALEGQVVDIDMTNLECYDYVGLVEAIKERQ